jgi:hypothetical protein
VTKPPIIMKIKSQADFESFFFCVVCIYTFTSHSTCILILVGLPKNEG